MTESAPVNGAPLTDLYTRNGFAGPATVMVRRQYTPAYTRVEGEYCPYRLEAWQSQPDSSEPRALPVTLLRSPTVRLDVWQRTEDTPFAVRDVHHDQVFYVLDGHARLETDFGVLDLEPMDMVRIPRSVALRLVDVRDLHLIILATANALHVNPENDAVLSPAHVDAPRAYGSPDGRPGEHELVIRHGEHTTSYFYDYDPLPIIATAGAPVVQRFNLANVNALSVKGAASPPARLIDDPAAEAMIFYLGARDSGRPPVHHNADYDEIGVYAKGPGVFGALAVPGTAVWVPKGVIHQGPEENVPDGYVAWLIETRANLELTEAGRRIAQLAETNQFEVHPTVAHLVSVR
jgi:homogentisate 1,2-dioxygenase